MAERSARIDRRGLPRLSRMPRPPSGDLPLSLTQQRLWLLDQLLDGSVAYNNVLAIRLHGPMDARAMTAALTLISRRHDALRTSFPSVNGEPRQRIAPPGPLTMRYEDLAALPADNRMQRARQILAQEQLRPYDLAHGPLARYLLVRLDAADHVLAVCMHHIICDAGSFDVIRRELGRFYPALASGREAGAEPLALQYGDYALWQLEMATSGRWDSQLRFWRQQLHDAPRLLSLPADRPRPRQLKEGGDRAAVYQFSIGSGVTGQLRRLCRDCSATPFMAFFAVFALLLSRYQPQQRRDVVIGVPFDGRFDRRLGDLIGMFINTLAVRVRWAYGITFRKLLTGARDSLLQAYGNADVPFDWVVRELAPSRDPASNPLFRVMFQLQHADSGSLRIGELAGTGFTPAAQPAKFDITFSGVLAAGVLNCEIAYSTALFDQPAIALLANQYQDLAAAVAADPDRPAEIHLPSAGPATAYNKQAADNIHPSQSSRPGRPPATALEALLRGIFADILGQPDIELESNFFDLGGHSLLAIKLMQRVNAETGLKVPAHALFRRPTIAGLADLISGRGDRAKSEASADMAFLADVTLDPAIAPATAEPRRCCEQANILLTGATGLLGGHILAETLSRCDATVWCLVRAAGKEEAFARIQAALAFHRLWDERWRSRIVPVCGDLAHPLLGLTQEIFGQLSASTDVIFHVGASVNLMDPYDRIRAVNVLGVQEILRLAACGRTKPVHYVSTISTVVGGHDDPEVLPEDWSSDPRKLGPNGYLRSKWVAEQMVRIAQSRGMPTVVYRPSRLAGDSRSGAMTHHDAFWHYVRACVEVRAMPTDADAAVNLVPVDFAAAAFVHLARTVRPAGQAYSLSSAQDTTLTAVLSHVRDSGYPMREVPYLRWVELLGVAAEQRAASAATSVHSVALLDSIATGPNDAAVLKRVSRGNLERDLARSHIAEPAVGGALLDRYLTFFRESGFLPPVPAPQLPVPLARGSEATPPVAAYWRRALDGYGECLWLGIDRRGGQRDQTGASEPRQIRVHLSAPQTGAIRAWASDHGLRAESALHSFAILQLHRYTGARDIVYGAARGRGPADGGVLPVRVLVDDATRPAELARGVQRGLDELAGLAPCSLSDIAAWTGRAAEDPLFSVVVAFDGAGSGCQREQPGITEARAWPLTIVFRGDPATAVIELSLIFDHAHFADDDVRWLAGGLICLIETATMPPDRPATIGELMHRTWQAAAGLANGRGAAQAYEVPPADLLAQFDAVVRRAPDAIAVRHGPSVRNFSQLDQESRAIASALMKRGLGAGSLVAVYLEHCCELLAVLLGVLRAGAAFVPVDPADASRRSERMLLAAKVSLTVHGSKLPPGTAAPTARLAELLSEGATPDTAGVPLPSVGPGETAYVIFTSGSTGEPKGVQVSRRALSGYVSWAATRYLRYGGSGAPLFTSIAFDLTLTQIFPPLAAGQTVHIVDRDAGVEGVAALLTQGVSFGFVKLTPAHLRLLMSALDVASMTGSVSCLVLGGEQLPADLARSWRQLSPGTVIVNEYGPTEATIGCCVYEIGPSEQVPSPVPIGRPAPGTVLRVLDERGDPVPDGARGELYIGGPCLADGYYGKPELTAERFIADPLAPPPATLYRTGDLVRWQPGNVLAYLGRNDDQIKIRGYRIEPAEVEAAIRECHGVVDCAVTCWARSSDDLRLVASIVPEPGKRWAETEPAVLSQLRRRLPGYLVPAHLVPVTAIPLTRSGKIDRRGLTLPAGGVLRETCLRATQPDQR